MIESPIPGADGGAARRYRAYGLGKGPSYATEKSTRLIQVSISDSLPASDLLNRQGD